MTVRGFTTSLVVLAAALTVTGAAPATSTVPGEKHAFAAVRRAHVDGETKTAARTEITRAAHLYRVLPSGRREHIAVALEELAAFEGRLTKPRTLALVGQLKANDDYFSKHYAPADKTDITDGDGLVYRYFAGRCFEFHPLANMGALNARVAAGDIEGTRALADALIARGVWQRGGGIGWEYDFAFGGGRAPWLSGMAQAVAAQAFARASELVPARTNAYLQEAEAAYNLIPRRMLTKVAAGPWIRLYAFNSLPVLNAQLQAVISLQSYAETAQDAAAGALARRMQTAAAEMLPRFDSGYWTYYSLGGDPSPLDYQQYVVALLKKLGPRDQRFATAAVRIGAYQRQPPAFMVTNAGLGSLRFWLSKPASVRVVTGAGPAKRVTLYGGWHTLGWGEPKNVGVYPVQVSATDWAGNQASFEPLPIVRVAAAKKTPARATSAAGAAPLPAFTVGAGLDDPSQTTLAKSLGLRAARATVTWPAGATAPDPALVAELQAVPAATSLIVDLEANPLPLDDAGREALAQYAAALVQQLPSLGRLELTPNDMTSNYASAFTLVRDTVQEIAPGEPVGLAVDGSLSPKTAAQAIAGTPADFVAFRPAPAAGTGLWTVANIPQLLAALGQQLPVLVDGLPAATAPAAIASLACDPNVAGAVVDGLADVDGSAVKTAAASAQRGTVVCPGLAIPAAASTLTFPDAVSESAPVSVRLGCSRDCLYLVTLDDADGHPVVARRGALRGGFPAALVTLPQAKLKSSSYRIDVRLVNQVNPGPVTQQLGDPLPVSP